MYYHPCLGCTVNRKTCARRAEIKAAIAGLNITSIKFKCDDRLPLFMEGQRVSFPWAVCVGQDHDGEGLFVRHTFKGTVVGEASRPTKFTVRVDADSADYTIDPKKAFRNGRDVVNVKSSTLKLIDEPARKFCPSCLQYEGETGRCQSHKSNVAWETYISDGCLEYPK